jgi:hypothetical protein
MGKRPVELRPAWSRCSGWRSPTAGSVRRAVTGRSETVRDTDVPCPAAPCGLHAAVATAEVARVTDPVVVVSGGARAGPLGVRCQQRVGPLSGTAPPPGRTTTQECTDPSEHLFTRPSWCVSKGPTVSPAEQAVLLPSGMSGRAGCSARGPGARWTPWHAVRPPGASRGANEVGLSGWSCRLWPAQVPSWFGGGACGWRSGMPPPSGQIPPPWAWWEIEAPAARAVLARPRLSRSVFRPHEATVSRAGRWNSAPRSCGAARPVRTGRRAPSITLDHLQDLRPKVETPARTGPLARERRLRDHAARWRRRYALWCRSREGAGMPRQRQSAPRSPPGQIPPPWARWEIEAPTTRAARGPSQAL